MHSQNLNLPPGAVNKKKQHQTADRQQRRTSQRRTPCRLQTETSKHFTPGRTTKESPSDSSESMKYQTSTVAKNQHHSNAYSTTTSYMSMAGKGTVSTITTMTTTSSSAQSITDEYRQGGLKVKTLAELQKDGEEGEFLVAATVVCVEYGKDWAYQACKICRKKLQTEGQTTVCTNCGMADAKAVLRYKLIVRVVDETDTALFLLWDKESVAMVGKSAADLSHSEDLQSVPPEVDAAVANKEVIFKVNVEQKNRASEQVFPVLKIERDSDIIKALTGKGKEQEGPESGYNLVEQSAKHRETVGSCSASYSTPLDSESRKGQEAELCEEDIPAKNLIDEFSTTIPKKRLKRLKQEK